MSEKLFATGARRGATTVQRFASGLGRDRTSDPRARSSGESETRRVVGKKSRLRPGLFPEAKTQLALGTLAILAEFYPQQSPPNT
jgi:hypothetical protein